MNFLKKFFIWLSLQPGYKSKIKPDMIEYFNLRKKTGLSEYKFGKAKNELLDTGFIDTKQVYGNKYVFYII